MGGGPNGAALGPDGRLYVCNNDGSSWTELPDGLTIPGRELARGSNKSADYVTGSIQVVDLDTGEVDDLYTSCGEYGLSAPNDIVFDVHGGFYFTDSGKRSDREMNYGALYYARADGSEIHELAHPLILPNGVGLSPEELDQAFDPATYLGASETFIDRALGVYRLEIGG